MSRKLMGRHFLALLRSLPAEDLDLPAETLLAAYDKAVCGDCGRHHPTVWSAIACDGFIDARARRIARHAARHHGAPTGQPPAGERP